MIPLKRVVVLLILVQVLSVIYLWTITPVGTVGAGRFAIFLAVDLLSFTTVGYVFTHERWSEAVGRFWILAASAGLVVLLIASLFFP